MFVAPEYRDPLPALRIHIHDVLNTDALLLAVGHKVVDDAGPGAIFGPEAERLILHRLTGEFEQLVPHVAVDGPGPLVGQEVEPQGEPVVRRRAPGPAGWREDDLPELLGVVQRQRALVALLARHEGVAVHFSKI